MKKIITLLLILAFAFVGCAGVAVKTDDVAVKKVLILATARIAGYELVKKEPKYADTALMLCNGLLTAESTVSADVILNQIMKYAEKDPLVAMTLMDVMSLIEIQGGVPLDVAKLELVKAAAQGFAQGVQLGLMK